MAEVLSDPGRDLQLKRHLYARSGVPECWVVDPYGDRAEVYRLREGLYPKPEILEPGETLTSPVLPGYSLDVADLLQRRE